MIYAFMSGKKEQDAYIKGFASGIDAKLVHTKHFIHVQPGAQGRPTKVIKKNILPSYTGAIFAGLLRGNSHILDMTLSNRLDFYYVDHAYFNSGYKYPNWMRVTKNGFVQNQLLPDVKTDRFRDKFSITFDKYKFKNNSNIVVFPPSNTVARVFKGTDWEKNIINKIKEYTDRPIVVRKKNGPVMDSLMINIESKEIHNYNESIEETLDKAYCVIAFNSAAALTALQRGIPVICERYCPAFPLSHTFSQIENLEEKDRLPLFSSLAWGQFTLEEIRNPKTFAYINSVTQWKGPL